MTKSQTYAKIEKKPVIAASGVALRASGVGFFSKYHSQTAEARAATSQQWAPVRRRRRRCARSSSTTSQRPTGARRSRCAGRRSRTRRGRSCSACTAALGRPGLSGSARRRHARRWITSTRSGSRRMRFAFRWAVIVAFCNDEGTCESTRCPIRVWPLFVSRARLTCSAVAATTPSPPTSSRVRQIYARFPRLRPLDRRLGARADRGGLPAAAAVAVRR